MQTIAFIFWTYFWEYNLSSLTIVSLLDNRLLKIYSFHTVNMCIFTSIFLSLITTPELGKQHFFIQLLRYQPRYIPHMDDVIQYMVIDLLCTLEVLPLSWLFICLFDSGLQFWLPNITKITRYSDFLLIFILM